MIKVKIYGERNSGTHFITQLIKDNFICDIIPGTLADAEPGYRKQIEDYIENSFLNPEKRLFARHILIDNYFQFNLLNTLGWKHGLPPLETINSRQDKEEILFISVTKNPYAWILSLFRRPYDILSINKPDNLASFISEPWLSLKRDNLHSILKSPVELWNFKTDAYLKLNDHVNILNVRYEDVLSSPTGFLEKLSFYLEKKSSNFSLTKKASKQRDYGIKDYHYYHNYYINELWRKEISTQQLKLINNYLSHTIVKNSGYKIIDDN